MKNLSVENYFTQLVIGVQQCTLSLRCLPLIHALTINYMKYWLVRLAAGTLTYNTVRMD